MFRKLLGEDRHDYIEFDVEHGEFPADVGQCPVYLVTGSASDAFGGSAWIAELKQFLNAAKGKAALVGLCFGHQVMAEAFGGTVARSPSGWGMGNHSYDVVQHRSWSDHVATITLPAFHRDQVVELPPAAEVVACNAFSPFGFIAYNDQPAISLQLHPEFDSDFAAALIENRRGRGASDAEIAVAKSSLQQPADRALVGGWINQFIMASA
ncbi:MAG: type 1 glutamine amidotransferase [Novosphingobium sp.]